MKFYNDPELEVVNFTVADVTNTFGDDNEVSAGSLLPNMQIDW